MSQGSSISLPIAAQLWKGRLVAKHAVDEVFSALGNDHLHSEWAQHRDAAVLTLGTILSAAVRRRLKNVVAPPPTSTQEYRDILKLSKEFEKRLASLQERDDPPPRLPRGRSGRTPWESWALGAELGEPRGAKRATERIVLARLLAYYQLSSGTDEQVVVPNSPKAPLYAFLEAAFGCARQEFRRRVEEDDHRKQAQLMHPSPAMLEKAKGRKAELAVGVRQVQTIFDKLKTRCKAAGLDLPSDADNLSGD